MHFRILFILLLIVHTNLIAQKNKNLDSLFSTYETQKGDEKAITAYRIADLHLYNNPEIAKRYALASLKLANTGNDFLIQTRAYNMMATYYGITGDTDSSKIYYSLGLKKVEFANSPLEKSKLLYGLGITEFNEGNLKNADSLSKLSLIESIAAKDSLGIALAYQFQSNIHENQGFYDKATKEVFNSLEILEKIKDSARIADTYNRLGVLEHRTGNFYKAIEYNLKAVSIYDKINDISFKSQALNDIGVSYIKLEDYNNSEKHLLQALKNAKSVKFKSIEASSLQNLGKINLKRGDYKKAIEYYNQSIKVNKSVGAERAITITKLALARAHAENGKNILSIKIIDTIIPYLKKTNNLSLMVTALEINSLANKNMSNYKIALDNFELSQKIKDSLFNLSTSKQIESIRSNYELDKKQSEIALQQKEIKTLNQEVEISNLRKGLYAGGMFTFLVVSGLLYFGFKQRIKKNKIEREKQEAIYQQEIEFKKKELASQTLHLVQKNTFIQELKENLEKIKKSPELFKVEIRRLVMLHKKESAEDKDWEVFKSYFSEVHNNFDNKIKTIAEDISEKEIRLASFLRMNLSTKEIASMLNVLPESVLKSKYRLKKKLNLNKETDLNQFLNTL